MGGSHRRWRSRRGLGAPDLPRARPCGARPRRPRLLARRNARPRPRPSRPRPPARRSARRAARRRPALWHGHRPPALLRLHPGAGLAGLLARRACGADPQSASRLGAAERGRDRDRARTDPAALRRGGLSGRLRRPVRLGRLHGEPHRARRRARQPAHGRRARPRRGLRHLRTHSSVAKSLRIAGFLSRQIRVVPTDAGRRLDVAALAGAVADDRAAGQKPFAVVASAGTTNTGAIDPLAEIAALCAREALWMHVDGAFGASALLSPAHRGLLAGIERADSIAWDAHKWLFQTYGCGMTLVRDAAVLAPSFALASDYLRDGAAEGAEPNYWDLGPELTRPARAVRLWLTFQAMGREGLGAAIAHGFALAETAERLVRAMDGWRLVSPAQMAITAFRYAPEGLAPEAADAVNASAARRLMDEGFAVVGTTRLDGRLTIRMCTINPATSEDDLKATLERLDGVAQEIAASG
ncbi:hypothetical protein K6K41_08825 [Chenggangzhangella methanolivorans]|uniref:Aspartate aminotransferase family protein n=1 Tax=Chenggangzhangella methanolivorans TaxID=1437009 RepID=A0A9E6RDD0_9HYPH|nr:hypothetical protein K6K41_08825 [Chenggangzhangella methanolivorans]